MRKRININGILYEAIDQGDADWQDIVDVEEVTSSFQKYLKKAGGIARLDYSDEYEEDEDDEYDDDNEEKHVYYVDWKVTKVGKIKVTTEAKGRQTLPKTSRLPEITVPESMTYTFTAPVTVKITDTPEPIKPVDVLIKLEIPVTEEDSRKKLDIHPEVRAIDPKNKRTIYGDGYFFSYRLKDYSSKFIKQLDLYLFRVEDEMFDRVVDYHVYDQFH